MKVKRLRWLLFLSAAASISGSLPSAAAAEEGKLQVKSERAEPNLIESITKPYPSLLNGNPQGIVRWEKKMGSNLTASPVIGPDKTIYAGTKDYKLYAIGPDGTQKWEIQLEDYPKDISVSESDSTIYVNANNIHKLYAIDPAGTKKWEFIRGGSGLVPLLSRSFSAPAIGADGTVFVGGSDDTKLYAVNPDGTKKWEFVTGGSVASPAVGPDGTIYAGTTDGNLYAIKPNGLKKWSYQTNQPIYQGPVIGDDGTIYVNSFKNFYGAMLYSISPNGTKNWSYNYELYSSPAIGTDGTLYAGNYKQLMAIHSDGTIKWALGTGNNKVRTTPAIGADGTIYAGADNSMLYAVDSSGKLKWEKNANGFGAFDPTVGSDNTVYTASFDSLFALGTVAASSVGLSERTMTLQAGDSATLTANVVPEDAVNKRVRWSSSDDTVAAVDQAGKVTGIGPGTAKITVKTEDGGFTFDCIVTVTARPESKPPAGEEPVVVPGFIDISGHWASTEIAEAAALGIVNGYPDDTFRPDNRVTRAEFAVMLMNGLMPAAEGSPLFFADKEDIGVWAARPVAQAVQLGIISGYEDGTFRPNANITHAEMIAMVMRGSGLPMSPSQHTGYADDADIPDWAKAAAATAGENGIIAAGSIADNNFAPQVLSTRAEAASAIVRMLRIRA